MSSWTHERARVASLSRDRAHDDPELIEARRNLRAERLAARIAEYAADVAATAPELTDEQRARIAVLLSDAAHVVRAAS